VRAIVPCGGRGTRMLALTHGAPKELLPVGGVPVLQHVLRECAESGISDVLIVIGPEKEAIRDVASAMAGKPHMPACIEFVVQRQPRGLADAIRCGRSFAGDDPVAVALPDNLFVGAEPAVAQVSAAYNATGKNVVGVIEIQARNATTYGPTSVYAGRRDGDLLHITHIPDKGARSATFDTMGAPSALTGVGRYVFTSDVFGVIDRVARALPDDAELDDIPVMQALHARGEIVGRVLHGTFLDVGLPQGYREASRQGMLRWTTTP
jgi:UTP--glucose-1-phosphate uridylyltransferase